MSPSSIARGLELTTGSVTTLLDRLEELGLVERRPAPNDRRSLLIHLTEDSFVKIGPIYRGFAEELMQFSESLPKNERKLIVAAFSKVASLCEAQVQRSAAHT